MRFPEIGASPVLSVITIAFGILMTSFILLFGVANLISPDVPESYLDHNTRVCVVLILTGLVIIYAIFRPYSGRIILCICALIFFIIVISNPVAYPIILLGVLSIISGRLNHRKVLEEADQTL
jgi:hypothetical protein